MTYSPVSALKKLFELLQLQRKEIANIYLLSIVSGLVSLSLPLGIQAIISFLMGGAVSVSLIVLISCVVLGVLLNGLIQVLKMGINEKIQQQVFTRLAFTYTDRLKYANMHEVDAYNLPERMNRFFEVSTIQKSFAKLLIEFPTASIQILFAILLISLYSPIFLFFGLLLIVILVLVLRYSAPSGWKSSVEESSHKYDQVHWLEEMASGLFAFRKLVHSQLPFTRTEQHTSAYLQARNRHFKVLRLQYVAVILFKVLITALLLILGAVLFLQQQLNLGQFVVVEIVIFTLVDAVEKIILNIDGLYDLLTSLEKVATLSEVTDTNADTAITLQKKAWSLELKQFSFRFREDTPYVLKDVHLMLEAGQKMAIMASMSAGRSALLKAASGLYHQFDGSLLLEGYAIKSIQHDQLYSGVQLLLRDDDLFDAPLLDNITMARSDISMEKLKMLMEITGLAQGIVDWSDGLNTYIEKGAMNVSAGLRQKILLCRALLPDANLLLMEDCWEYIESEKQKSLVSYLLSLENTSILLSSNQVEQAMQFDKIAWMKDGTLAGIYLPQDFYKQFTNTK